MKIEAGTSIQRPGSISQNVIAVFVGCRTMTFPAAPCKLERKSKFYIFTGETHTHTHLLTHSLRLTHTHTNSPTITPPSLLYFLFPSCFSMLSLSLEKLVTCGVIRSYIFCLNIWNWWEYCVMKVSGHIYWNIKRYPGSIYVNRGSI